MKYEKMIQFIVELRKERGWSQEAFANELHRDKSTINRWEKGTRRPDLDALQQISELFEVSLNEILAGKRETPENKEEVEASFYHYTKFLLQKVNRTKLILALILIFSFLFFSIFATFYFFQNYRSMKVYIVYANSENYKINDGLFVVTKENIYFQFGDINPKPTQIRIYKNDDIIYQGDSYNIIRDFYGYKSLINYYNLDEFLNNAYLEINGEKIKLTFEENYENNGFFYSKNTGLTDDNVENQNKIPTKIQEQFTCDELNCILDDGKALLMFDINSKQLNIDNGLETWNYNLNDQKLIYIKLEKGNTVQKIIFEGNNITCEVGNCENAKELYETFLKNYYNPYLTS